MVVDHRPRAITIIGFTQEEKEELMPHFVVRLECLSVNQSFIYPSVCLLFVCQGYLLGLGKNESFRLIVFYHLFVSQSICLIC